MIWYALYISTKSLYFLFLHSIETLTDSNGTPLQSKKNFHSTDKSPFQRYYTKSGSENNRKDVSQTRSSIRHFDMSSPLRLLRRSCPQSPQLPQSSIQQGTYFLMLYLKKTTTMTSHWFNELPQKWLAVVHCYSKKNHSLVILQNDLKKLGPR